MHALISATALALALNLAATPTGAEPRTRTPAASREPWSDAHPEIVADVRAGEPLTLLVYVPLCSNKQIACGGQGAGDGGSLKNNLYWGRGFGARRYFDESARGWRRLEVQPGQGPVLEQVVYRRTVPGGRWGLAADQSVEQLLVLRAVHGEAIDEAVDDFYAAATRGARVRFRDAGTDRDVRVHVAGYAGHNRLMDGRTLPTPLATSPASGALPSFVLACRSDAYFTRGLKHGGSEPLLMTRDLMAPEGYVIAAMANALGDNDSRRAVRQRVVRTYGRWQRLSDRTAATIFSAP